MSRRALAVIALLTLALPALAAADVDPHPRSAPTQSLSGPITAFAMSASGATAAGMADPGRSLGQATNTPVFTWWDAAGNSIRSDRADENNCATATVTPLEACIGDVVGLALSSDGQRLAVAATGNNLDEGRLLLFNAQSGPVANFELPTGESPTSVAMSLDGTSVAVGLLRQNGASADTGRVRLYSWPSPGNTPSATWSADVGFPVKAVDLAANGRVVAIAADRSIRFSADGATAYVHDTDANLNAVAAAGYVSSHWSVAGAEDGGILLYSDAQDTANPVAAYDLQPGSSPQRAVAMATDGRHFVAGDATGVVRLFRNPDLVSGAAYIAQSPALDGAVSSLRLSGSGSHLVATAGRGTYLFRVSDAGLSEVWHSVGTGAVMQGGVSSDGELVASASGSAVTVFTAVHAVAASPAAGNATPGQTKGIPLTYTNTGNRDETVPLTVSAPADWVATVWPTSLSVPAGATATALLNVTPPSFAAPGTSNVAVTHRVRGIPSTANVPVDVVQVHAWSLSAEGALSRSVAAGGDVSFHVRAQNLGNGADLTDVLATIDQAGWQVKVAPPLVSAGKGGFAYANVTVTAPADAGNGASAKAVVRLSRDAGAAIQVTATVGASFGVQATAVPTEAQGLPGQTATVTVRVRNTGNAPDSYTVSLGGVPNGWTASESKETAVVQPGQTVDVPLSVAPAATAAGGRYQLTVQARSLGDGSRTSSASYELTLPGGSSSTTSTSHKAKGGPGPELALVGMALLGAVAAVRRRR